MAQSTRRGDDIKVLAAATALVLAVGGLIFAGIYFTTRGGKSPTCGRLPVGSVDDIRSRAQSGPYFDTGGGSCGFLLALDGGDIVAYQLHPRGMTCTIKPSGDGFSCGGQLVDRSQLLQYPTSIETQNGTDELIVDLRTPAQRAADTTPST